MRLKTYILLFVFITCLSFANAQTIELKFTGKSGTSHIPLTQVLIENMSQGGDTLIYYPDTVLLLGTVGIDEEFRYADLLMQQNYPNPFYTQTTINVYMPEGSVINLHVNDIAGKEVISFEQNLSSGFHTFTFSPCNKEVYFLTARYKNVVKSIRMIAFSSDNNQKCELNYIGTNRFVATYNPYKSGKGFQYAPGDQLKFTGSSASGIDTIIDSPVSNAIYEFDFTFSGACQGISSLVYGGQTYNTVPIGTQCWMKENLNIGARIDGSNDQTDNSVIEKYCYDDHLPICDVYGGLYQWDEMMQYNSSPGAQGICPWGWHIPTDNDWTILTDYLGGPKIAGGKLKETGYSNWHLPNAGATNSSGFTALPGGYRDMVTQMFYILGDYGFYLTSTEVNTTTVRTRYMQYDSATITRFNNFKNNGYSVRCLKDTCSPMPTQANAGPDTMNIVGDSIVLMANTPVYGQGNWTVHSGTGWTIIDSLDPATLFYGVQGNVYKLVWTISNNCGSISDTVILGFGTSYCGFPFVDLRDSTSYNTVQIGSQCWMAENLAFLPDVSPSSVTSDVVPHFYVYDYQGTDVHAAKLTSNYNTYGVLYNWAAAMNGDSSSNSVPSGVQGICPAGWHLPGDSEWMLLEGAADSQYSWYDQEWYGTGNRGFDVGRNLKSTTSEWYTDPNSAGIDAYGFKALPGGMLSPFNPGFSLKRSMGFFRTSTDNGYPVILRALIYDNIFMYRDNGFEKETGASVRCVRD